MQTVDQNWIDFDGSTQWGGDYMDPSVADYMSSWWDPAMEQAFCASYGQGAEFAGRFEDWTTYDGSEDWSLRAPKFPPPNAPAPAVVEGMATMLEQVALDSQALMIAQDNHLGCAASIHKDARGTVPTTMKAAKLLRQAQDMGAPPGFDAIVPKIVELPVGPVTGEHGRPQLLGLSSLMEFNPSEIKETAQRSITPATTAPPTPASSLSECEASSMPSPGSLPQSGAAPGSDRFAPEPMSPLDTGSGYSLFGGTAPWHSVQLGAIIQQQQQTEDLSLPAKVLSSHLAPIGPVPAKVRPDELLCKEDALKKEKEGAGPPPGLFAPGPLLTPPGLTLEDSVLAYKMMMKRPPGLELAPVAELLEELPTPMSISSTPTAGFMLEDKSLESVTVEQFEVDGITCTRAVWRIVQLRGRLKTSLGKPVVSPPFTVAGLGDLRLMVTPDAKGTLEGMRGKSKQSHFAKMLSQGPLECSLKVKVPSTTTPVVRFHLTVGPHCRQGPFTCDFMQHTVHGCNDFDCDWLKQVDEEGCLCVGLEIVEICTDSQRPA